MRSGRRALTQAMEILREAGHVVHEQPTTGPGEASAIARECIAQGADLILAAGGDGTINEVINGMAHSGVPLAILPGGTANVLAVELGLGRRLDRATAMVGSCVPARVSLGLLRPSEAPPRYFLLMAGIGFDAHIVYNLNLDLKAHLGKLSYWLSGFGQLGRRLEEFDVWLDGGRHRCSFALASRVRNYGGDIEIARSACLLENKFEMVLFQGENGFQYLRYFAGVLTDSLPGMEGVVMLPARQARFSAPAGSRVYIQVDGEYAGRLPAGIELIENALTLLVPPDFRERATWPA
jgi:YegS/Rv2252/BmrU family lipid kinase